jgi:hypothetical protein
VRFFGFWKQIAHITTPHICWDTIRSVPRWTICNWSNTIFNCATYHLFQHRARRNGFGGWQPCHIDLHCYCAIWRLLLLPLRQHLYQKLRDGQKKWIWWLATMSYDLRCYCAIWRLLLLPLWQHLYQKLRDEPFEIENKACFNWHALDLLQDLMDMDGNTHESLVASVREHMEDT